MKKALKLIAIALFGLLVAFALWVLLIAGQAYQRSYKNSKLPSTTHYTLVGIVAASDSCNKYSYGEFCHITFDDRHYGYYNIEDYATFKPGDRLIQMVITQGDQQTHLGCNLTTADCVVSSVCYDNIHSSCWSNELAKDNMP